MTFAPAICVWWEVEGCARGGAKWRDGSLEGTHAERRTCGMMTLAEGR